MLGYRNLDQAGFQHQATLIDQGSELFRLGELVSFRNGIKKRLDMAANGRGKGRQLLGLGD